jgi:lipid-binding SYLF domain-containing protein
MKKLSQLSVVFIIFSTFLLADSAKEIQNDARETLSEFYKEVSGGKEFLAKAKAFLVFPKVREMGFMFGGKYGEGVLYIGGKEKAFYSITSASFGFQMGIQQHDLVVAIVSDAGLKKFLNNDDEWEGKIDANVVMVKWSSQEELDDIDFGDALVGFVFDTTGMMGNMTMEGTKFERIHPD